VTIVLEVADWPGHRAGQHLDIRLTAEDGYQAERSYSIASAPGEPLTITVERLDDGEVSPYLTEELRAGDELELRGPIGGYFVWDADDDPGPLLLAAGGSGIVPLRAILRHRERTGAAVPARLLYSARSLPDVVYREELDHYQDVRVVYTPTRVRPPGWTGPARRVDAALLADVAWPVRPGPARVCLRADQLRRGRGRRTGGTRLPAGPGQDRAFWRGGHRGGLGGSPPRGQHRRHRRKLMDALDGNAIGGLTALEVR
jgi:NAD(P)H-flavin reductase